ncbi:hypothetical protein KQI36_06370 [Clostridium senegalense]|uniref:hypothetical protein n=1 Tax=Clostridium senegalense TaxID=1465809 RepID=UPI001C0FB6B4|nr:hypothetical protein [Clostridium senegalense]MBU5226273.1 hypothetical protein [Clostridium senegalense]
MMVDIDTHQIIDIIFSRELNDVVEGLKIYLNLKIVSRDGYSTYKNTISLAQPKVIKMKKSRKIFK